MTGTRPESGVMASAAAMVAGVLAAECPQSDYGVFTIAGLPSAGCQWCCLSRGSLLMAAWHRRRNSVVKDDYNKDLSWN
jgi:hypothetical protein